jgi:hypothetical protein
MEKDTLSANIEINHVYYQVFITEHSKCVCSVPSEGHHLYRYYFQQGGFKGIRFDGVVCAKNALEVFMVVLGKFSKKQEVGDGEQV